MQSFFLGIKCTLVDDNTFYIQKKNIILQGMRNYKPTHIMGDDGRHFFEIKKDFYSKLLFSTIYIPKPIPI